MQKQRQTTAARIRRMKAQHRRNMFLAIVISLLIGLVAGYLVRPYLPFGRGDNVGTTVTATRQPASATETASANATARTSATAEPGTSANQTATGTQAPSTQVELPTSTPGTQEIIVPFGSTQTVEIDLNSDGTLHTVDDGTPYERVAFDVTVLRYLTNDYYADAYGTTHSLKGNETGVEIRLLLKDYTGALKIDPNRLNITLLSPDGVRESGYKLTDAEIQGKSDFELQTNVEIVLYKRFDYSPRVGDMQYLVITTVTGGVEKVYKFELGTPIRPTPTPAPTIYYETLSKGSKGDSVVKLQEALIEGGYLEEGSADGAYGNMTVEAVKAAQKDMELEEDGVASIEFQKKLYGEE